MVLRESMLRTILLVAGLKDMSVSLGRKQKQVHTSQLIGAKSALPHLSRAQMGVDLALADFPVITLHSLLMCLSMRIFGSCPGGIATGLLHNGPFGNQYEVTDNIQDVHTTRCDTIMFALIISWTLVGGDGEMVRAETLRTMITFERQEVYE